jgi:hypothetical protein
MQGTAGLQQQRMREKRDVSKVFSGCMTVQLHVSAVQYARLDASYFELVLPVG